MADSNAIKAGSAFVELLLQDLTFQRGLDKAMGRLKSFGHGVATIGAGMMGAGLGIAAPLAATAYKFVESGAALNKASKRLGGVSVQDLGKLKSAAGLVGVEFEELEAGIGKFQKNLSEGKLDKFLGNADELKGLGLVDQFKQIADALKDLTDADERSAAAQEIFGKGGRALLPLLDEGAEGIEKMVAEMAKFGPGVGKEGAQAAEEFERSLKLLEGGAKKTAMVIGSELIRAIQPYLPIVMQAAQAATRFVIEHKSIVLAVAGVAAGLIAGGAALIAFGMAFSGIAAGVVAAKAALLFLIGAALNPITWILVGIIALIAALGIGLFENARKTETFKNAWQSVLTAFDAFKERAKQTLGGIWDAIKAGDWALAFRIGFTAVKEEWQRILKWMHLKWYDFIDALVAKFENVHHAVMIFWNLLKGQSPDEAVHNAVGSWFALLKDRQDRRAAKEAEYDRDIQNLSEERKRLIQEAHDKAHPVGPLSQLGADSMAARLRNVKPMDIGTAAQGLFDPSVIRGALRYTDKTNAAIEKNTRNIDDKMGQLLEELKKHKPGFM